MQSAALVLSDACSDLDEEEGGVASAFGGVVSVVAVSSEEGSSDEEEGACQPWMVRRRPALRMLDSDGEEEEGGGLLAEREFLAESSLPPLRLDSVGGSDSLDPLSPGTNIASSQPPRHPPADSGVGESIECGPMTDEDGRREGPLEGGNDGESLESSMSFQWGQSLPLAQSSNPSFGGVVRHAPSQDDGTSTQDMWREESQAMPTNMAPSQSVEDETQFLDEDG